MSTGATSDQNTILVVDDDDDIRELLKDRLEFLGHHVLTAQDGLAGVESILVERPDLVLLDIQMPVLDGFGVLREIKAEGIDIQVIMITANATIQRAVEAMQQGASDFLMKPFQPETIEQRVNRALRENTLKRENERLQAELAEAREVLMQEMLGELEAAHTMQMALMPEHAPEIPGYDIAGLCIPSRQVGGDYYTFLDRTHETPSTLGIFIADISGKGMQAATVAMRLNEMFRYEAEGQSSGEAILEGLDRSLRGRIPSEMFSTCGIAFLDTDRRELRLTSAACPEVYHYVASPSRVEALQAYGFPVGLPFELTAEAAFGSVDVTLELGDLLVFPSDGVAEAMSPEEDFYGEERLKNLISDSGKAGMAASEVRNLVVNDVFAFIGEDAPRDDLTVIVLRVC